MTLPNKITIARICLIPVFALAAWGYGASIGVGRPDERLRVVATGIFIVAAATDGLDGFIARHFNQRTRLGSILDPIADKCLVAAAILAIALGQWPDAFPVWFAIAVLGRESLLAIGFFMLPNSARILTVHSSLLGKIATVLQVTAILWVLLGIRSISTIYPAALAALFTLVSGAGYLLDAVRQVQSAGRRPL
jgi:CDP-diacylglycerol--glycerol-3-phosphate 3-phosphatidyltransferase